MYIIYIYMYIIYIYTYIYIYIYIYRYTSSMLKRKYNFRILTANPTRKQWTINKTLIVNCPNYCTNPPINPRRSSSNYSIICICKPKNLIF